jgi:hypothetical protein
MLQLGEQRRQGHQAQPKLQKVELMSHIFVGCHQNLKPFFNSGLNEFAVRQFPPAQVTCVNRIMSRKAVAKPHIDAVVQQNSHSRNPLEAERDPGFVGAPLQDSLHLQAADIRVALKEILN